jgi:asparagine synthase (glutamine-hydrolysing)
MCGIVGIHGPQEPSWLKTANALQRHRGPDGEGAYVDRKNNLALAMRRLAIVDFDGGVQPMQSDDGRHVLIFNGEIFNSPRLRQELEARGERFRTGHSDTEVLLRLLVSEGESALVKLNGMFAFAFYDSLKRTLLLARDRLGIKPLYYTQSGAHFAFASELKSLLALPFVSREIDRQSLFHYLSLMYVPGERSILRDIYRLAPGHLLRLQLDDRTSEIKRWWTLCYEPDHATSTAAWPERIRATLDEAVDRWCLSDVPIAASLSGGLDSSGIVGLARRRGRDVRTVSVGFTGEGEVAWNELPLAAQVADMWKTEHTAITIAPDELLGALPAMVWHLDEPYGGGLPSWAVFREMSRLVKVGLTGVGGDEMFGNYGKWSALEGGALRRLIGASPTFDDFRHDYFDRWHYFPDAEKRRVLLPDFGRVEDTAAFLWRHYSGHGAASVRDRTAQTEIGTQLADEFLHMVDRFSMAHSLEARTPFLDNAMVDLVRTIPAAIRTRRGDLKGLLRQALAPILPKALLTAPKRGFVMPLKLWLRGPLRPLAERLLAPERLRRQGLFQTDIYHHHVRPHLEGKEDLTSRAWGIVMFQLWHSLVVERPRSALPPEGISDLMDVA